MQPNASIVAPGLCRGKREAGEVLSPSVVFFYAAARPRFGPGPMTAVRVAVALWAGGYVLSIIGAGLMGMFPPGLLVWWAAVGLAEMILAALAGGWMYREGGPG
jgi:hypothetical protein